MSVVVVGGGVTGLTAAYKLARGGAGPVTLLEARARVGGNIQTERRDGFVIDGGPDSFVVTRPQAAALCKELGLEADLIPTTPKNRKVYIARGGDLLTLPDGLMLGVPTRFLPMVTTRVFSWAGKVRMGLEPLMPKAERGADESIARFMRRRLGREALERIAEPLLGGIYAGDVESISMRASFPQLVDMEDKHGSLIKGALVERRARAATATLKDRGAAPSPFLSLSGGMGQLIDALAAAFVEAGGMVRTGARVEAITTAGSGVGGFSVRVRDAAGEASTLEADHVVVAAPAHAASSALADLDAELAERLATVPYLSTGTVVLAYARVDVPHALDAVGVVIPRSEKRRALAATFISSKWAARCPDDMVLLRVFVGGHRDPRALSLSDDELVALARDELAALVGVRARPAMSRVFRFERGNPQPVVGHGARVARMRALAARHPGLWLAGAAFDGVGIPDCVRQANEVAAKILAAR
ncbi:MAG TPA: protoporphyrinogen oxidase [Byssovorax sp.]